MRHEQWSAITTMKPVKSMYVGPVPIVLLIYSWFVIPFVYGWPIPGLDRSALAEPDRDAASPGQQHARASFPARTAISEMFHCDYRDRDQFSFDSVSR